MRIDDYGNLDYSLDQPDLPPPSKKKITDPAVQDEPPVDPAQWTPGSSAPPPGSAPPGMHWDPTMANYVADAPAAAAPTGPTKPGGGNINDPAYLDSLLSYYGSQPGINPSVKNDPNYWKQAVASGRFNGDENYLIQRFFQPEGPPEGAAASAPVGNTSPATVGGVAKEVPGFQMAQNTPIPTGTSPSSSGGAAATDNSQLSGFLTNWLAQQASNQSTVNTQRQGVLDRLGKLADSYGAPVTADDPNIKAQTDAYHGTTARAVNAFRKQAAERAYAEGVPTGAFDAQIGNAEMSAGQNEGNLQSQLMTDELHSRRQALTDTLSQSGNLLTAQDQSDLNNKIAAIDASLKSQGINLQDKLGTGSLNLQDKLGTGNLNLGARGQDITQMLGLGSLGLGDKSLDLQKLLGMGSLDLQRLGLSNQGASIANQGRSIDNQNNQFYDQFGANQADKSSSLDSVLTQLILSGGLG